MRPVLKMPDFRPLPGMWIDPEFLSAKVREELRELATGRGKASEAQASALIEAACSEAHFCSEVGASAPGRLSHDALVRVADRAHDLLHALGALHPSAVSAFSRRWDTLVFVTDPPRAQSGLSAAMRGEDGGFLGALWVLTHDLRDAADYAAQHVTLDRSLKPKQQLARGLVRQIASAHKRIFGTLPKAYKGHWFPEFCATVGAAEPLELKIGRALVDGVLGEMSRTPV